MKERVGMLVGCCVNRFVYFPYMKDRSCRLLLQKDQLLYLNMA